MKFVLIVIWVISGTTSEAPAIAMHEFDSADACENAGKVFIDMARKKSVVTQADWSCVEKAYVKK